MDGDGAGFEPADPMPAMARVTDRTGSMLDEPDNGVTIGHRHSGIRLRCRGDITNAAVRP